MLKKNRLTMAVAAAMGSSILAGLTATPALAQGEQMLEEVIVTGSRIARNPLDYVGPMTIVGEQTIAQQAAFSIEGILRNVPQVTLNGTSENISNAGQGFRSVELRNLGEFRTLVLVNGHRAVKSVLGSGLVNDLNNIPTNMVDRIEVLADGSSAVYGSDAVAGVVNVILKDDFEGVQVSATAGTSGESDGEMWDLSLVAGTNFDRGNITFGVTHSDEDVVWYEDRNWAEDPILAVWAPGDELRGSGIPPEGKYYAPTGESIAFQPDPAAGLDYTDCDGPNAMAIDGYEPCRFNYNVGFPISLLNPNEKTSFLLNGHYDLGSSVRLKSEIGFTNRSGTQYFPGLPIADSHGRYTDMIPVPFTNPHIPADARAWIQEREGPDAENFIMYWRAQDAGKRIYDYEADTVSTLIALEGNFGDSWSWDTVFNWGRSKLHETTDNQVNVGNLRLAVDPDACAQSAGCSEAAEASGSPAIDIFGRHDVTGAFADYILFTDTEDNEYEMLQWAANISTSDLFELPAGSVGFAAGIEYRDEEGGSEKSAVTQSGESGGNFAASTFGRYDVTEIYGEFSFPLLKDLPAVQELSLDVAGRYSDYNTVGEESTYKLGLSWRPIEDLRVRVVSSTSFRAPDVMELFGGVADSYDSVGDPCTGWDQPGADPVVAANCQAAGVPPGFVQNAAQLRVSQGGNEDLDAETADNLTVGLVITPRFWDNFSMTLDYYDIEVKDAVDKPDPQTVIDNCYTTPGLSHPDCDRIDRNDKGTVSRFAVLNENLNTLTTSGVDLGLNVFWETGLGTLTLDWLANYLIEYEEEYADGSKTNFTGSIANDLSDWAGYPRIRSNIALNLARDNWDTTLTHRYIHKGDAVPLYADYGDIVDSVDAMHYWDLTGAYRYEGWEFRVGVDNLTDEEPEFIPSVSTNTSLIYDLMGRYYWARVGYSF